MHSNNSRSMRIKEITKAIYHINPSFPEILQYVVRLLYISANYQRLAIHPLQSVHHFGTSQFTIIDATPRLVPGQQSNMTDTSSCTVAITRLRAIAILLVWASCASRIQAETQSQVRDLENRIIGGTAVSSTRYPYHTKLDLYFTDEGGSFGCGASLIAPDVVLTAAHCLKIPGFGGLDKQHVQIWVNRTSKSDKAKFGFRRTVVDFVVHPSFDHVTLSNDIAVMKLNAAVADVPTVRINRNVSIPLSTQSLTAIGFGATESRSFPDNLMQVSMKPVSFQVCKNYARYQPAVVVGDQMVCAGGTKDTCYGDSGSPLIVRGTDARSDVQVGITSFGSYLGCGKADAPGVYTRVSYHARWIDKQLCLLSSKKPTACPRIQKSPTRKPTRKLPTRKPTRKLPTRKPTRKLPTRNPTRKRPTRNPTRKRPTRKPTTKLLTRKP